MSLTKHKTLGVAEIKKVLDKHKIKHQVPADGKGNITSDCPFCGADRQRFGIRIETNAFNCFKCDTRGLTIASLDKKLSDLSSGTLKKRKELPKEVEEAEIVTIDTSIAAKVHKRIRKKGNPVLAYARQERGFSNNAIKHFQLGFKTFSFRGNESNYLAIPYFENGNCVNLKYRTVEEAPKKDEDAIKKWKKFKWKREKGGKSSLYNSDCITPDTKTLYIVEAELDLISLWSNGIKNVVSTTVGAKGFKGEWKKRLKNVERIYIIYDNDIAGQEGARLMAKRLGYHRCYNVTLPEDVNDVNEFFWDVNHKSERYSIDDFHNLVSKSTQFEVPNVYSGRDLAKQLLIDIETSNEDSLVGIRSPWPTFNEILPQFKPGHMMVIAARPKVGKTSLALYWFYVLLCSGHKLLFICCEMNEKALLEKMLIIHNKDWNEYIEHETPEEQKERKRRAILEMCVSVPVENIKFHYPNVDELKDDEKMRESITECVQNYGTEAVVFDNIQFVSRSKSGNTSDVTGVWSRMFKSIAEQLDLYMFLISQPRRTNHNRALDVDDLKDSSSIFQDLDHLILAHRAYIDKDRLDGDKKKGVMEDMMQLKVVSRWGEGGTVDLWFNGERGVLLDNGPTYEKRKREKIEEIKRRQRAQRG